ncbi:MAG: carboxypeptidase regulatory-like domain-containing protein [Chloroflexi bacterium]|nr:carboxypeptidase regulatory-like domain-containing protein [Chloroflexota bacterium]
MKMAMRILAGIAILLAVFLLTSTPNSRASDQVSSPTTQVFTSEPVTPALSRPVREIEPQKQEQVLDREINPIRNPGLFMEDMGLPGSNTTKQDPLEALSWIDTGRTPNPIFTFEGLGTDGYTPPDTIGEVGPNHYVQMVNVSFAIFDKSGNVVQGDTPFNALFTGSGLTQCASQNDGDPIVVWDSLADRWLLSQFAVSSTPEHMCIAISQTPDPTGAYYLYQFAMPDFPDYFKFGVWPDAYYMGTNTGFPNQYYAYAFDRVRMLAGQPATFQYSNGHPNFMMPADLDGPTAPPAGSPGYFYTMLAEGYPNHPAGVDRLVLYEFDVDWVTPANSTFGIAQQIPIADYNYTVCGFFVGNCIPQPATAQRIDSLSYWPMWRFAYRNLGGYEAMVGNFTVDVDGTDRAAIRWFELQNQGAGWILHQEGTHAPDSDHRFMGSIAMDGSGNIALGYSVSSSTTRPSIRYATRLRTDPLGTLQAEASLYAGVGSQTGIHRWGDYSSINVDPTDECTFWYTNEYHDVDDAGFNWNTRIGVFRLPECTGTLGPDFTIEADPAERNICTPADAVYDVTVNYFSGYNSQVNLSASGLPPGATATFVPSSVITPTTDSVLTIGTTGATAGSYNVNIVGIGVPTPTHTTTVGLNLFTAVPGAVTLVTPADTATNIDLLPTFSWNNATQAGSYYLEVATDGAFSTIVYTATVNSTSHQATTALNPLTTYYWRVTPSNTCGGGAASAVYSFTTRDIPPILLVDDDDNGPDVRSYYTDILDNLGLFYDVWDTNNSDNEPTAQDLSPYSMVIWFTGDEFGGAAGPGAAGEAALGSWLDGGSCLFLSSQDYRYDRNITPFMTTYLGVATITNDDGDYTTVTGQNSVFGGLGPYTLTYPFTDFSDPVNPDATAEVAFLGNNAKNAAINKDSGVYRTTFWAFPFEAMTVADREESMQVAVAWCGTGADTGTLAGNVSSAVTTLGIQGATVTAVDGSYQRTVSTNAAGDYNMTVPVGTYSVTAAATNYVAETVNNIVVLTNTITTVDFVLDGSVLTYSPAAIEEYMDIGDVVSNTVTVTNTGPLPIDWSANISNFGGPALQLRLVDISIPRFEGTLPADTEPQTTARPPQAPTQAAAGDVYPLAPMGEMAYALDVFPGLNLVLFPDVDAPGTWTAVGGVPQFHPAGDFLGSDFSKLYALDYDTNQFVSIDTATAARTVIGTAVGNGNWAGMTGAVDGTLYAVSSVCGTSSTLYTINPATAALTQIGSIGAGTCIIDIAINAQGEMYGVDLISDALYQIDTSTGVGTVVGPLGVAANFAQGMDFEQVSGVLYWAAYTTAGEMRVIDTTTGASALVGGFPGGAEVDALGFATFPGGAGGWASAVPNSGTIPANSTATFEVVFDASSLYQTGDYTAELNFSGTFVNQPPTMPLTMHLGCPTCGILAGDITDARTGDPLSASIHITGPGGFDVTLNGSSYSNIAVQPGSYTIAVSANGYFSDSATVTATTSTTTVTDFALVPEYGELVYSPAAIEEFMSVGDVVSNTVTVTNTGTIPFDFNVNIGNYGGPLRLIPLTVTPLAETKDVAPNANFSTFGRPAAVASYPLAPFADVNLVLDDGTREDAIGLTNGGQFIWLNRFTPAAGDFPFTLTEVQVLFGSAVGVNVGELVDIYVYEDTDGDGNPGTGANFVGSILNAAVQATNDVTWSVYPSTAPIVLNGPGDVLIAVVNRTAGTDAGEFPASIDQTASVGRSWIGLYTGTPGNPPTLPADSDWGTIDSFGLPGNWMVRGYGSFGAGSGGWASAVPNSGTVPAGSSVTFEVVFDASALLQVGTYTADLSFSGNFENTPPVMPLTMHLDCPTCGFLEGSITDALTGDPLTANIHVTGGSGVDVTVSGDSYSLSVPAGSYDIEVTAAGYFDEMETVAVAQGATVTTDFALTPIFSELVYAPQSFEVTVGLGTMLTETLLISNTGTAAFDFVLSDVETGNPLAGRFYSPATTCPPDAFGYTCTDSNEADGLVAYDFEDIAATGTAVALTDDSVSAALPIGFAFDYYGTEYSDIYISSNGFLTVLSGSSNGCCTGGILPDTGIPNGVIAGWWEDLNPSLGGTIQYQTMGSAPSRYMIVQFTDVPHFGGGNAVTLQYKLFEGSNNIEVHYQAAPSDAGTHSAGIENETGTIGLQYYRGTSALPTPLAVCYLYPGQFACGSGGVDAPWLVETPNAGTIAAGDETAVSLLFDASVITQTGTYTAELYFNGTFDNVVTPATVVMHVEQPAAAINLDVTVSATNECGTANTLEVAPGSVVYYCYTVSNTGNVMLPTHTITDTVFGHIATFIYDLLPGASESVVYTQTITANTASTARWTASHAGLGMSAMAEDSVSVTLATRYIFLPVIVKP